MGRIIARSVASVVALVTFVTAAIWAVLAANLEDRRVAAVVATLLLTGVAVWIFMAPAWVLRRAKAAR